MKDIDNKFSSSIIEQELQIKKLPSNKGDLPFNMFGSEGTGFPLIKFGKFGADLIRFQPGKGIKTHIHPGNHILYCVSGTGCLVFDNLEYKIEPGVIYFIHGLTQHEIKTSLDDEELTLISIADDHRLVDSEERSQFPL